MIFRVLLLTLLVCLVSGTAWANSPTGHDSPPKWTVTVDPLTVSLGFPHLQIERAINPSWSVYAGPHTRLFDGVNTDEHEPFYGVGGELAVRWFPAAGAPTGLWISGRTVAAHLWTYAPADPATSFGGYTSGLIGYTWLPLSWLVLSGGIGIQYLYYDIEDLGIRTLFPAMHTAVGIAF